MKQRELRNNWGIWRLDRHMVNESMSEDVMQKVEDANFFIKHFTKTELFTAASFAMVTKAILVLHGQWLGDGCVRDST